MTRFHRHTRDPTQNKIAPPPSNPIGLGPLHHHARAPPRPLAASRRNPELLARRESAEPPRNGATRRALPLLRRITRGAPRIGHFENANFGTLARPLFRLSSDSDYAPVHHTRRGRSDPRRYPAGRSEAALPPPEPRGALRAHS